MAEMPAEDVAETSLVPSLYAVSESTKCQEALIKWYIPKTDFLYNLNGKYKSGWLGNTGCRFHFTLFPSGRNMSLQGYVSLMIYLDLPLDSLAEGTLSIVGKEKAEIFPINKSLVKNNCVNFDKFDKTLEIMQHHLKNNDLIIQLSIKMLLKDIKCDFDDKIVAYKSSNRSNFYGELFKNKNFVDVTFILEDQEIKAHKVVLLRVPYFKRLFEKESKELFHLKDIKYNLFKHVLKFIYTEEIPPFDFRLAYELYVIANDFDYFPLQKICASYLGANLTAKNYLIVLLLSKDCNDRFLLEECLKFIQASNVKILSQEAL